MSDKLSITIRDADRSEVGFLKDMLFEAAYWRADVARPAFAKAFESPELQKLLDDWGRAGDTAVVGEQGDGHLMGAAWYRFWTADNHSYGFVADDVPELGIGVRPDARGRGVGTALLEALVERARKNGVRALSLSVERDNRAIRLYKRLRFERVAVVGNAYTMQRDC